jgi:hypothetical protein
MQDHPNSAFRRAPLRAAARAVVAVGQQRERGLEDQPAAQLGGARPPQQIWVQTTRRRPTEQAHHLV